MAGNTKLLGFTGSTGIVLSRWGGRAEVTLPAPAVAEILAACKDKLPRKAPQSTAKGDFIAQYSGYNDTNGTVEMVLLPDAAERLASFIRLALHLNEKGETKLTDGELLRQVSEFAEELREHVQAHRDFVSTEGEPGVADAGSNVR